MLNLYLNLAKDEPKEQFCILCMYRAKIGPEVHSLQLNAVVDGGHCNPIYCGSSHTKLKIADRTSSRLRPRGWVKTIPYRAIRQMHPY